LGILDLIAGRSLEAVLAKARRQLGAGDFDDALKTVGDGLARYPDAQVLRETAHAVRRAQARAGMQALKDRVAQDGDPAAFEELVALYRDVGMTDEEARTIDRYAEAHPELAAPHLMKGERALDVFFADLRAADGRRAVDALLKAGALQPDSLKPRILLAEVFFAIQADKALLGQAAAIERLAGDDEVAQPVLAAIRDAAKPAKGENVDALLARVEVAGSLPRDPSSWSGRKRRGIASEDDGARIADGMARLVRDESAEEAVAIDRSGAVVASVPRSESESALAGVARTVARTIKVQARELELGSFRRFVVEGPFGVMVVADANGGVTAAKAKRGTDPLRLCERMSVAVDGVRGRRAS
jgi:hypothetical protein